MKPITSTVEPVLKDHPIGHKNVVCQDRWSLVTGSVILKCRPFCQKYVVCQDRWSLMAVVSQDRFHCIHVVILWHEIFPVADNSSQCHLSGDHFTHTQKILAICIPAKLI